MNTKQVSKNLSNFKKVNIGFIVAAILLMALVCYLPLALAQSTSSSNANGYTGLAVKDAKSRTGAQVVGVDADSPAQKAGIKPGNIIVKVNKARIKSAGGFNQAISGFDPGTFVDIGIIQDNVKVTRGLLVSSFPGKDQSGETNNQAATVKDDGKKVYGYVQGARVEEPVGSASETGALITIAGLNISTEKMAPEAYFDLSMELYAKSGQDKADAANVVMIYSLEKEDKVIVKHNPENLNLPNALPVTIVRKCRAKKEKGLYKITIVLEMEGVTASKSVNFQVE